MPDPPPQDVTRLLQRLNGGGREVLDEVMSLVFEELRGLADRHLQQERVAHTLQPTALVHEAYLRLVDQSASYPSRMEFFGVAAMMMRRVLIDHARGRGRDKRGAGRQRVELDESLAGDQEATVDLLALDDALRRLEAVDERKVRIVELRYFAGRTIDETAQVLGIAPATVSRDWEVARRWLAKEIGG